MMTDIEVRMWALEQASEATGHYGIWSDVFESADAILNWVYKKKTPNLYEVKS